jgi:hypothetical protein
MTTKCSAITSVNKLCSNDAKINGLSMHHAIVEKIKGSPVFEVL